jgi:hypothetical protein
LASRAELADQVSVLQNIAGRTEPESLLQIPGCSARKKEEEVLVFADGYKSEFYNGL